jgi:hypothetical protein
VRAAAEFRGRQSICTERTMSVLCQFRVGRLDLVQLVGSSISAGPPGPDEVSMESLILAQDERWRRA